MTAPTTIEEPTEVTQNDTEEPKYAHYVDKSKIVDASVFGTPLVALCGHKFVPGRNPDKLPVCPKCKKELDNIRNFMQD